MSVHAAVTVNRPRDQVEDLWRSTGPGPDYARPPDNIADGGRLAVHAQGMSGAGSSLPSSSGGSGPSPS
jgi:hypothetical protein